MDVAESDDEVVFEKKFSRDFFFDDFAKYAAVCHIFFVTGNKDIGSGTGHWSLVVGKNPMTYDPQPDQLPTALLPMTYFFSLFFISSTTFPASTTS
jgi:hypothetical protein